MLRSVTYFLLSNILLVQYSSAYSALEDARIIAEYRRELLKAKNHAKIARNLVHQANWASVGTISTEKEILGFPMVNIISVDDSDENGKSTGKIHFMLVDLDFTGSDWRSSNKVTFLFSDEQNKNCQKQRIDPMEPTCARTILSGKVIEMDKDSKDYEKVVAAYTKRHPAAINWLKAHNFYMCELDIKNIYVLDYYGGPHNVTPDEYYNTDPDN